MRWHGNAPSAEDFAAVGVPIGPVAQAFLTVASAGGKWHRTQHACRNAGTGLTVHSEPVLAVDWTRLCRNCWKHEELDPCVDAALYAVRVLHDGTAWVARWRARLADPAVPWTWSRYARMRTQHPVPGLTGDTLLTPLRGNRKWSVTASGIRAARASVVQQITAVLDEAAALIGDPELDSRLARAITHVTATTTALDQSTGIHRIGARTPHETGPGAGADAWTIAAGIWRALHRRQQQPDTIGPSMLAAVLARYDHVHDLAALPCQPNLPVTETDCPHTWARRIYHAHIGDVVQRWSTDLSQALTDLTSEEAARTDYAVAVPLWPPTRDADAPLAFLTQFPVLAVVDRYIGPHPDLWGHGDGNTFRWEDGYATHRPQIAVVRVPEYAAEQVTAISPNLTVEPLTGGRTDRKMVRRMLARSGLPLLPEDLTARSEPSELVRSARDKIATPRHGRWNARPFAPGAHPPRWEPGDPAGRDWHRWEAHNAWAPGCVFLAGIDNVDLLAQAVPQGDSGCPVRAVVELPADPLGRDLGGTVQRVHIDRAGGIRTPMTFAGTDPPHPTPANAGPLIAIVEATLYGVSADRTALLLAPAASQDPFPVPMNYLVSVTRADNR